MLRWLFPKASDREKELEEQIFLLWENFNRLSAVVAQMSDLLHKGAIFSQSTRQDLDYLGQQTLKIVEQQNKLIAHVLGDQDLNKIHLTTIH